MSDKIKTAWFSEATNEYFTPKVRLVRPNLFEPRESKKFPGNPTFNTIALVPGDADITVILQAVQQIAAHLYGPDWKAKAAEDPALAIKMPIKKTANYEWIKEYADEYPLFLNAKTWPDYPPTIFGPDLKPVDRTRDKEAYSGRWAIIATQPYGPKPEKKNINRYVSLGLQRVQLLDHDEPIVTGHIGTAEGFEPASASAPPMASIGSADELF